MERGHGGRDQEDLRGGFSSLQLGHQPALQGHPFLLPRQDQPAGPSPDALAQTTAICGSKHFSLYILTSNCLKDVHGRAGAASGGPPAYTGGLGTTSGHWLSDIAYLCISAHGSNFCRKGEESASGPGISRLQLPVAASAHPGQPPVLTSTTVTSSPRGNRAQGQGLPQHPDDWAPAWPQPRVSKIQMFPGGPNSRPCKPRD